MYEKMLSEYNSVEAVGSAMEEANKSANNWTGSINKLKNSWTKLVNQFVNSDDVVMVIQELDEAVQDLSSSETITGIKTVTSSVMQLFSALASLKNKLTSISLLGDVFEHTFGNITGLGLGTFKSIGKIVDFFNKGEKEAEELRVRQEELRESYISNIQIYDEEVQTVNKLIGEYTNLVSNSENVIDIKDSLLDIQKQLIEKYGEEANGIDLVNNSIQENIDKLIELQRKKNEIFLSENKESIQNAYDWFGIGENGVSSNNINTNNAQLFTISDITSGKYEEAEEEADKYFTEIEKYIKERYGEVADNIDFKKVGEGIDAKFVASIKEGLTSDEIIKSIDAITDAYKSVVTDSNFFNSTEWLESVLVPWQEIARKNNSIIQDALEKSGFNKEAEEFEKSDAFKKYNSLISKAIELNQEFSKSNNLGIKTGILSELDGVKNELKEIASEYPVVNNLIQEQIGNLGNIFTTTSDNIELAKEIWNESLEEMQKGTLANVDKITEAIQKMYSGKALGNKDAWEILGLDDNKTLSNISIDANGEYIFQTEQLVALKDELINKEIEEHQLSLTTAQNNIRIAKDNIILAQDEINRIAKSNMSWHEKWAAIKNAGQSIKSYQTALTSYIYTEKNESLVISELQKKLGDLSNTSEVLQTKIDKLKKSLESLKDELSALNKEADARLKAQEHVLDNIIDGHKKELEALEKEKEALEEQLEVLEKQKSETEEIIDNYKTVADVVTSAVEKEIKSIEDERDSIEKYYDEQINKLKKANDEREDAIEYEEKLANLANAQKNKVRVHDQERGWTYEVNKEELKKAQDDLKSFETNQQIKELEKQKEVATQGYDKRIESLQDYADQWTEFVDSITESENELLAEEILGSNWRDKITKKDLATFDKFKTGFINYNNKLKNLVDTEIASVNKSIEAKDKDVKAKQEQIQAWEDYKSKVQETAKTIKDSLEDYKEYLNQVGLSEKSTNEERQSNLESFASKYKSIIDEIASKNSSIEETEQTITELTEAMNNLNDASSSMAGIKNTGTVIGGIGGIASIADVSSIIDDVLGAMSKIFNSIFHFAKGGAADYTGLAWVDGSKTSSETVFTAAQSKKLLNLVDALPNMNFKLFNDSAFRNGATNNTNSSVSIGNMTVVANNPQQFADQFSKEMNRYWKTKLTENKVY